MTTLTLHNLKKQAHQFKHDHDYTLSDAYEAVARLNGFNDWHHAQTTLKARENEVQKAIKQAFASVKVKGLDETLIEYLMEKCEWYTLKGSKGSLIILPEHLEALRFEQIPGTGITEEIIDILHWSLVEFDELPDSAFFTEHGLERIPYDHRLRHDNTFYVPASYIEARAEKESRLARIKTLAALSPAEVMVEHGQPFCATITADHDPGKGYRVHFAIKDYPYLVPTGGDGVEPWYWGQTEADAQKVCEEYNANTLGISKEEAEEIVMSSMSASFLIANAS